MSDRFDNELTSEKGVGKVFDKVNLEYNLTSICRIRESCVTDIKSWLMFSHPDMIPDIHGNSIMISCLDLLL